MQAVSELVRLRELLGLSLDELRTLVAADRRARPAAPRVGGEQRPAERLRIVRAALGHVQTQLGLLAERRRTIAAMEEELEQRRIRLLRASS